MKAPEQQDKKPHDSLGMRVADKVTQYYGSWGFVCGQVFLFAAWMTFNGLMLTQAIHFDPWPYILLNLTMSAQAAFSTPIILMASNRQSAVAQDRNETLLLRLKEILEKQNESLDQHGEVLEQQNEVLNKQTRDLTKIQTHVGVQEGQDDDAND